MKEWLTKNILQLVELVFIGIVGIFISIQANRISASQLKLNQAQSMPAFIVNERQTYNSEHTYFDTNTIEVSCENGFFTNYNSDIACILRIKEAEKEEKLIPLYGYWFSHTHTGNTSGIVEKITGYKNNEKYNNLCEQIKNILNNNVIIDIDTYMQISYLDILSQEQSKYYQVETIDGTTIIDKAICREKIKYYDDAYGNNSYYDIDTSTTDDLKRLLNEE